MSRHFSYGVCSRNLVMFRARSESAISPLTAFAVTRETTSPKTFLEVVKVAQKLKSTVRPVVGLCFHSFAVKDVDHDVLWELSSLEAHT